MRAKKVERSLMLLMLLSIPLVSEMGQSPILSMLLVNEMGQSLD